MYTSLDPTPLAGGHTKFHSNGVVLQQVNSTADSHTQNIKAPSAPSSFFLFSSSSSSLSLLCPHVQLSCIHTQKSFSNEATPQMKSSTQFTMYFHSSPHYWPFSFSLIFFSLPPFWHRAGREMTSHTHHFHCVPDSLASITKRR